MQKRSTRLKDSKNRASGRLHSGIRRSTILVPDEFSTIQSAIDAASDDDTILVSSGTYNETVEIADKNISLQGADKETTIINGVNTEELSAVSIFGGNVNISGFTIKDAELDGIQIQDSEGCTIENNLIEGNARVGLVLFNSTGTITGNTFRNNILRGIDAEDNSSFEITDNVIENNEETGLFLSSSIGTITNNIVRNNMLRGVELQKSQLDLSNNTIEANEDTGLISFDSTVTITGNTIGDNALRGIELQDSQTVITDNTIETNVNIGIFSLTSTGTITGNIIQNNTYRGINIQENSQFEIAHNTIETNGDIGIFFSASTGTIANNTITNNKFRGIDVEENSELEITDNIVEGNEETGLFSVNSTCTIGNNTFGTNLFRGVGIQSSHIEIHDNLIEANGDYGLFVSDSSGTIQNNTIHENKNRGLDVQESSNIQVLNNSIQNNSSTGIFISLGNNIEISDNEITGTMASGFFGRGVEVQDSSVIMISNTIQSNATDGLFIFDSTSSTTVEIIDNIITDNRDRGIFCSGNPTVTGCCNTVQYNVIDFDTCSPSLAACPCPAGDTGDTLSITPSSVLLTRIGSSVQLTAIAEGENGATLNITDEARWTSSDENVATVNDSGLVTATGNGEAEICAASYDIQVCIEITVNTFHHGINQWTISNQSEELGFVHDIIIDPVNTVILYAGTHGGEIFTSTDNGETWQERNQGLRGDSIYTLAFDPANPHTLYAGAFESLYKSIDAGQNWVLMHTLGVHALAIDPSDTRIIYAGSIDSGMLKSEDEGKTFREINKGLPFKTVREDSLVIDPLNPNILYIAVEDEEGTGGGVFKTTDGGFSWNRANRGLPGDVSGLAIDPENPNILYAGTLFEGVFKTTDGGDNWGELAESPHEQNNVISIDTKNPDVVYVGNFGQGVYESRDGGESWRRLFTQLTNRSIWDLTTNPVHPTIFAGSSKGPFRFKHAFTGIDAEPNSDGISTDIDFTFNTDTGIDPFGFYLYRSTSTDGDFEKITRELLGPESTSLNDQEFLEGVTHVYKMTVVDQDGETLKSFPASAKPLFDSNPDFHLEAIEPEKAGVQGDTISFPLTLSSQDNFDEEIFFETTGLPEGVSEEFTPTSGIPPLAVAFTLTTGNTTPTGTYEVSVTASNGNESSTETVTLSMNEIVSNESRITQTINAENIRVGETAEITGEIIPAQNAAEVTTTFLSPSGETSIETAKTDENGKYSIVKTFTKNGTWLITTSWKGNEERTGASSQTQELFVSQAVTTISMSTNATSETVNGDTLTLTGNVSPNPGEGKLFLEIDSLDGSVLFNSFIPISTMGEFTHDFKVTGGDSGEIAIFARFEGTEDYGSSEKLIFIPIQEPEGMAIIVAGGGNGSDNELWEATNSICNYVYAVVRNQGISDDHAIDQEESNRIFYLHPDPDNDADGDGNADTDDDPTTTNLQKAITEWALNLAETSEDFTRTTPLTIYMMGPGSRDAFSINENETVTSADLNDWLNHLYTDVTNTLGIDSFPIRLILEAPHAGSFIDDLTVENGIGNGRVAITSTDSCGEESEESSCNAGEINITGDGSISFSRQFFFGVKIGQSVTTAWAEANLIMQELFDNQNPQLDADGDGIPNESDDEIRGSQMFINQNRIPAEKTESEFSGINHNNTENQLDPQSFVVNQRPVIKGVQKDLTVNYETATLWTNVEDPDDNTEDISVQGLLYPPKSNAAMVLELAYSEENDRFEVSTSTFDLFGLYEVKFVARDAQGNASLIERTLVNSQTVIPVLLKGTVLDNTTEEPIKGVKVTLQGVDGTFKTNKSGNYLTELIAGVYTISATKKGFEETIIKDFEVSSPDGVVTRNIELSPETSTSEGTIYGHVFDTDGNPINSAKLKLSGKKTDVRKQTTSDAEGAFAFEDLEKDTYKIKAKKQGYQKSKQKIKLGNNEEREITFEMQKE